MKHLFLSFFNKIIFLILIFLCAGEIRSVAQDKLEVIGADISSLTSLINSGVTFSDESGRQQDLCKILADNGFNHVRLRVWNEPYDEDGHGYGGGNCDIENAVVIGKQAKKYGLKVMLDFHYSDFWADPGKQKAPKQWAEYSLAEKEDAIYEFTYDSIGKLLDNGIDVSMVQIGNEINTGMCGEKSNAGKCRLLNAAGSAVRQFAGIMVVVHFTNLEKSGLYSSFAKTLASNGVDYDIFATSYYPYWHGGLDSLKKVLTSIKKNYNKDVMVAEFGYPFTIADSDCFGNTINENTAGLAYEVSVKGQTKAIQDIMTAMKQIKAIGVFYWEPAWLAVGSSYDDNKSKWEEFGSGWASSYAAEYDPDDAGKYYGGSSWDNQALFDSEGKVLESIKAFRQ